MKSTRLRLKAQTNPTIPTALLRGADGTDEDKGQGGTGGAGGDQGDKGKGGDEDDKSKIEKPDARITALEAEKNRHWEGKKAAEKERDDALAELNALRDKDKSEVEKAAGRVPELESENESLKSTNQKLALQVAFLKDNTYQWHNPERALALADLSKVEIDKDGKVSGLADALKALATSDPYLVKPKDGDEEDEDKGKQGERVKPVRPGEPIQISSGGAAGGRKSGGDKAAERAALEKRYPALRGR